MQSRRHSILEVSLNTASGMAVAWITCLLVYPLFGWKVTARSSFEITTIMTVISVLRSYFWRRIFNRLQRRYSV